MHSIDLPAGATVLLTATARPDLQVHRWDMQIHARDAGADAPARLSYGSQIGGRDCDQRIHVPRQDLDCRIEVNCRRATAGGGWQDERGSVGADTPSLLVLSYAGSPSPAEAADVVLTFAFSGPSRADLAAAIG